MTKNTIRVVHFEETDDVVARIYSQRGSTPIILRYEGEDKTDEEIGRQFREACEFFLPIENYTIDSQIFKP